MHVFERSGAGAWPEVARFDGDAGRERFGASVAVDAGTALVGQPDFEGTAHVLRRDPAGWSDAGDVPRPPTVFASAEFGEAVDLEGGRAVDLCLGGSLVRFNALLAFAGFDGRVAMDIDFRSLPPCVLVQAGETLCFQLWYRDSDPAPTSNTSDAVEVLLR